MDHGESSYRRFLEGDDLGLYELICTYQDGLILYLNSYVQNIHTAESLAEDTFAELAIKRPKFSGRCSFKTWLYSIARHIAVDHIRRESKFKTVPLEAQNDLADENELERSYICNEQKIMLHKTISSLKPEYQQILYLIFFEGFSNDEAGDIMKKNKRQIENLLYNAKKTLRTQLERNGFDYEDI